MAELIAGRTLADRLRTEIRVLMTRRELNLSGLAVAIDKQVDWVSRRLSGKTELTVNDLELISAGLGVDVDELLALPFRAGAAS